MVGGSFRDNEKIVVARKQDPPLLIGLADRLTRSSGDKHPFENAVPVPQDTCPSTVTGPSGGLIYCSA
jgi:hypothetical protein